MRSDFLLKLSLAVGPGFGILSCVYFLQIAFIGHSRNLLFAEAVALLVAMAAALSYRAVRLKGSQANEPRRETLPKTGLYKVIALAFLVALVLSILSFIFISLKRPHGEWDAWAVYNMKARFMFRAGENWKDMFSAPLEWAGQDYPLLWPATVAACWTLIGEETLAIPILVAMLFTFGTVGVVVSSIATLRNKTQGLLAGLVLLCTPYFITHGADQYSDIPIGFFYLATLVLLALRDELWEKDNKLLILAGVMAGLTAWTKNEGLLFIIIVIVSRFAVTFRKQGIKPYVRQMIPLVAGVIPTVVIVIYLKFLIGAQNGYLSPLEEPNVFGKITDFSRYRIITDYLVKMGLGFGSWSISVIPLLAFYLLLLGVKIEERRKRTVVASLITLGLMMAGFLMIYVISSRDLTWLIVTSLERLISQLWPSLVFIVFLIARTPEEASTREDVMSAQA